MIYDRPTRTEREIDATTGPWRYLPLELTQQISAASGVLFLFARPWQAVALLLVATWCTMALGKLDRRRCGQ